MMSILQRTLTLGLYSIVTGCTFLICETLERSGEQKYETLGVVLTCLRQLCHSLKLRAIGRRDNKSGWFGNEVGMHGTRSFIIEL